MPTPHVPKKPNYHPNFQYQAPANQMPKQNVSPQPMQQPKPTPMEIDTSKQFVTPNNWHAEKRQRETSFQIHKPQPSFQHMNKQQRVNNVDETVGIQSVYEGDSLATVEQESVFLDE